LKSGSATLGATRLVEYCRQLEELGRDAYLEETVSVFQALRAEFHVARAALE